MVIRMAEEEIKAAGSGNIKVRMKGQKADRDFLLSNYHDLLGKYRNQWVIIGGGKLLKVEKNPDTLVKSLGKIKSEDMLVYYLADPEDFMLL
jgi:hypothetical protein